MENEIMHPIELPEEIPEEPKQMLTVYYNRRTGVIKELCGGEQDMTWFGEEQEDYELIFDYLVVEYEGYVLSNPHQFIVLDGELKLNSEASLSKYL